MGNIIEDDLKSLIPQRHLVSGVPEGDIEYDTSKLVKVNANRIRSREDYDERIKLTRRKESEEKLAAKQKEQEDFISEVDRIESRESLKPTLTGEFAHLNGTTPVQVARMLKSLNISLDMRLTKADTRNLLATLLTCNEKQLNALESNSKIPLAIKTVIKAMKKASENGDMSIVERLWDRIFGTNALHIDLPQQQGQMFVQPNQQLGPVSREAYVLIRETLLGVSPQDMQQ